MAIFTSTDLNSIKETNVDNNMLSAEILYEFNQDIYKIMAASYVSDIMIESALSEGSTDIEPLVEGTIRDMIDKAIASFENMKAKIREWFGKVSRYIGDFTTTAKKFVKKNKDKIDNIPDDGKYVMNVYDFKNQKNFDNVAKNIMNNVMTTIRAVKINDNGIQFVEDVEEITKAAADVEQMVRTLSSYRIAIRNNFYIKDDTYLTEKTFVKTDIKNAVDIINSSTGIKVINDFEKQTMNQINIAIKNLSNSKNGENAKAVNIQLKYYKSVITSVQNINTYIIDIYKKMIKQQYMLVYMAVKSRSEESTSTDKDNTSVEDSTTNSIFETAYNMF